MRIHLTIVSVLLAMSVCVNLGMVKVVRNAQALMRAATYTPISKSLIPGESAPPLKAKTLDGQPIEFDPRRSGLPTVLYVIAPDCPWCARNHTSFASLSEQLKGKYQVIVLSTRRQGLEDYLREHPSPGQTLIEPSTETSKAYSLGATPTTIVLDKDGVVRNIWMGAYARVEAAEISRALGVRVPEIPSSSARR